MKILPGVRKHEIFGFLPITSPKLGFSGLTEIKKLCAIKFSTFWFFYRCQNHIFKLKNWKKPDFEGSLEDWIFET